MADIEIDDAEKARRAKILQLMNPKLDPGRKPFTARYANLQ